MAVLKGCATEMNGSPEALLKIRRRAAFQGCAGDADASLKACTWSFYI
jgi:hypothetical protein